MKIQRLTEEAIKKHFQEIIEDNKKYPPKVTRSKCNDCIHRIPRTLKCSLLYPDGIPTDLCLNKAICKEFQQK